MQEINGQMNHYDFKITQLLLLLCILLILRSSAQGAGPRVTQKVHNPHTLVKKRITLHIFRKG